MLLIRHRRTLRFPAVRSLLFESAGRPGYSRLKVPAGEHQDPGRGSIEEVPLRLRSGGRQESFGRFVDESEKRIPLRLSPVRARPK
jgi:hypothetical protein